MLTGNAQAKSGGKESYTQFWQKVSRAEVPAAQASGNKVNATIRFVMKDGSTSTEGYVFSMVQQDGKFLIDDFAKTA